MKSMMLLLLVLCLLTGCGHTAPEPTTEPPTEATTEANTEPVTEPPTEPPTEPAPVYYNPLTGEEIDAPLERRIFAVSINNVREAIPHYNVREADIYMEMFVNGSIIRGLALFADPTDIAAIGPVRSTRFMFSDIALHYDAIIAHAGGDKKVLNNAYNRGVDSFNIDTQNETAYSFRDMDRWHSGVWWEHCLFARGEGLYDKAVDKEIDIAQDPEKDYGLSFVRYGIPKEGESANSISVTFTSFGRKSTTMVYDEDLNQYIYHQYDQMMLDGLTGYPEAFQNVIIMLADIYMNQYGYHEANFLNGGTGYFACGGKLIPITWTCEAQDQPFRFFTEDGAPLNLQVGNTYMAIAPKESPVVWE